MWLIVAILLATGDAQVWPFASRAECEEAWPERAAAARAFADEQRIAVWISGCAPVVVPAEKS